MLFDEKYKKVGFVYANQQQACIVYKVLKEINFDFNNIYYSIYWIQHFIHIIRSIYFLSTPGRSWLSIRSVRYDELLNLIYRISCELEYYEEQSKDIILSVPAKSILQYLKESLKLDHELCRIYAIYKYMLNEDISIYEKNRILDFNRRFEEKANVSKEDLKKYKLKIIEMERTIEKILKDSEG